MLTVDSPRGRRLWLDRITIAAALLPILLVYAALARTLLAVPIIDDYQAMLGFVLELRQRHTLGAHLLYDLTAQSGEYRIMLIHLLLDAQVYLLGRIALLPWIWIGNLVFLPMLAVWWWNFHPHPDNVPPHRLARLLLFLPVIFLLCHLGYAEQLNWTAGMLYFCVPIAFAVIALLVRDGQAPALHTFAAALLLLALGCLTSPNCYLLVPIGLALLLRARPARLFRVALWCLVPSLELAVYLYHYTPVIHIVRMSAWNSVAFFLTFLGGAVENMHRRPIAGGGAVLGVLLLMVFAHAIHTRLDRRNPWLFYSAVWVLLTALMVARIRGDVGFLQSLSVRYKIYSVQLLAFCYVYLLEQISGTEQKIGTEEKRAPRRRLFLALALAASCIFSLSADALGYRFLRQRQQDLLTGMTWYLADPAAHSPMDPNGRHSEARDTAELARQTLNQTRALDLYRLPPQFAATPATPR